jgi:hypothetical protein
VAAEATQFQATALGVLARANGTNSLALGSEAIANGNTSIAIGAGVQTFGDNEVRIGNTDHRYYLPGVTSTLPNTNDTVVLVGTDGRLSNSGVSFNQLVGATGGFAFDMDRLQNNVTSLRADVEDLQSDVEDNSSGIAIVTALANATSPLSADRNFALGFGFGTFKSQQALGLRGSLRFTPADTTGARVLFNTSAGIGLDRGTFAAGAGLSLEW